MNEDRGKGTLQTVDERESLILAPFAMFSRSTRGRKHPEPSHSYRGPFQRDRDRVVHSAAFRRLSGKMQVFTGDMGDYHRTRLTHTQEVASIARTMARALRLNEDLVEVLALFHDIGHPPYGHAGEDVLDEWLRDEGGFSHNAHALTIAEELEHPYAEFAGLNLSFEVLEAQASRVRKGTDRPLLLEAQMVDLADSIAYDAHDIDDAIKLGMVSLNQLEELEFTGSILSELAERRVEQRVDRPERAVRRMLVRRMIDRLVSSTLDACARQLEDTRPASAAQVLERNLRLGPTGPEVQAVKELERFLYRQVYRHERLQAVRKSGQERLRRLLEFLFHTPDSLPRRFIRRSETVGRRRAVAEYVAGMTERYLAEVARRVGTA